MPCQPTPRNSSVKTFFSACIFALFCTLTAASETPDTRALFSATLHDVENHPVALARYKGQPLVVNFWARWCPPCRAEIPELAAFQRKHGKNLVVLGLGLEDDTQAVKAFAQQYAMNYPVLLTRDQGQSLMQALGNRRGGLPYTLFIDRNGQVIGQKMGLLREHDLHAIEARLLGKDKR